MQTQPGAQQHGAPLAGAEGLREMPLHPPERLGRNVYEKSVGGGADAPLERNSSQLDPDPAPRSPQSSEDHHAQKRSSSACTGVGVPWMGRVEMRLVGGKRGPSAQRQQPHQPSLSVLGAPHPHSYNLITLNILYFQAFVS